ncbi:hypothetical protein MTO96_035938 [Rhipicephalus appendiculatus]
MVAVSPWQEAAYATRAAATGSCCQAPPRALAADTVFAPGQRPRASRDEVGEARSLGEERAETTSGHGLRESPSPIDTQRGSRDVISRMEEHLAGSVLTALFLGRVGQAANTNEAGAFRAPFGYWMCGLCPARYGVRPGLLDKCCLVSEPLVCVRAMQPGSDAVPFRAERR